MTLGSANPLGNVKLMWKSAFPNTCTCIYVCYHWVPWEIHCNYPDSQDQLVNRCICVLMTEILRKISVARTRTLGRDEETLLSSGWTLIRSELSSPNFNSSVRAKWLFAIRYLNRVIKPLCNKLDIFLTTRLTPTFGRAILFTCFSHGSRPKVKDAFLDRAFGSRSCAI